MYLYWNVLPSVHACCLTLSAKQDGLRYLAFLFRGSRSPFVRSRGALRLSAFVGSLRNCAFICGDLDGVTGDAGTRGTGLAARLLCAFAQAHWLCESFRGEYVGGCAPPNLRQRVFDSLDSLHAAAGLCWCVYARRHPGTQKDPAGSDLWPAGSCCTAMIPTRSSVQTRAAHKRRGVGLRARSGVAVGTADTERPGRVQFMLGRVVLYSDDTYTLKRPDSSRPQAARSRVACAKRSVCRLSLLSRGLSATPPCRSCGCCGA